MEQFSWIPDQDYETDVDFQVRKVQFGNGVTQIQQTSLTPPKRKFSLTFSRNPAEAKQIFSFLMRQRAQRFNWRSPSGEIILVRCEDLKHTVSGFVDVVTCTFEEELI